MADSPVFISYDPANQQFVQRLAMDLKAHGVHVMPGGYNMSPDRAKNELLSQAQWLLLVRSPQAELSKRVQDEVDIAMDRTVSQRMQGVLAVSSSPSSQAGPPNWSVIRSFTATDEPSYERSLQLLQRIMSESQQAQSLVQASPVGARPAPVQPVPRPAAVGNGVRKPGVRSGIVVGIALIVVLLTATVFSISLNKNSNPVTSASPVATSISNGTTGTTAVTVTPAITPTATPITDPKKLYDQLQLKKPILNDPMDSTGGNKWIEETTTNGSSCTREPDKLYHSKVNADSIAGRYNPCMLQGPSYTNFVYQVSMTIMNGDAGGIIFRADQASQPMETFYRLSLNNAGNIAFVVCTVEINSCQGNYVTDEGTPKSLQVSSAPYQSTNTLAVMASGTTFYIFVNQKLVTQVDDVQIKTGGGIGVYAASITNGSPTATNVAFSNVKVWTL